MPGSTETGRVHREEILTFVARYHRLHDTAPTLREVATGVGLQFSTVAHHVRRLVDDGRLERRPKLARSLRVVDAPTGLGATTPRTNDSGRFVGAVEMHSRDSPA